jgi:hypothetical protein
MSGDTPVLRASDADRERTVALLREHAAEGRLTLEEFTERMSAAYRATTQQELEDLGRDLPTATSTVTVEPASRRSPTRYLLSIFGSVERSGRIRVRDRVMCLVAFGNMDLDLRNATLEGDSITVFALCAFGAFDLYVPESVEVDLHGLALLGHKHVNGSDRPPQPGTPLVRVYAFSLFGGMDVWLVPAAWAKRKWREIIRGIEQGEHRELEA